MRQIAQLYRFVCILIAMWITQSLRTMRRPFGQRYLIMSSLSTFQSTTNILHKPRVIFVLGGPASGKGTQCLKLSNEFGMKHLSAGELLREEQSSGSSNGKLIDSIIKEGKIVPVQITLDLLKRAILEENSNRFLIDGFPRNWDNLNGWERSMLPICDVEAVMFIDCPEQELEKRLLSRGLTSGRSDDNLATARKRFATFYAATMPIVDHYASQNKLIRVRGDTTIDEVYKELSTALVPLVEAEVLKLTEALVAAIDRNDRILIDLLSKGGSIVPPGRADASTTSQAFIGLVDPVVKIMGKTAIVSYARAGAHGTRIWNLQNGHWKCVHSHIC